MYIYIYTYIHIYIYMYVRLPAPAPGDLPAARRGLPGCAPGALRGVYYTILN